MTDEQFIADIAHKRLTARFNEKKHQDILHILTTGKLWDQFVADAYTGLKAARWAGIRHPKALGHYIADRVDFYANAYLRELAKRVGQDEMKEAGLLDAIL